MSVLKKPKRNIRRRDFDNEENEHEDSETTTVKKSTSNKSLDAKVKKEKKKPSILSFEEEWNDGKFPTRPTVVMNQGRPRPKLR